MSLRGGVLPPKQSPFGRDNLIEGCRFKTADWLATKAPLAMRGDMQAQVLSHLPDTHVVCPPKLAPASVIMDE